jgi:hypothetical protein
MLGDQSTTPLANETADELMSSIKSKKKDIKKNLN